MDCEFQINWKQSDLHVDALILLLISIHQPVEPEFLLTTLDKSKSTVYGRINKLKKAQVIKDIGVGRTMSLVMCNYVGLVEVFKYLEANHIKEISIADLANFVHKPPEEIRSRAYQLTDFYDIEIVKESDVYSLTEGGKRRLRSVEEALG
ncbi:MAG: hypothetical protein ACTSW1_06750 [Candidatus Hodarchaeales archaeon]